MATRIYIYERVSDWSGPQERIVEEAYYGPFDDSEESVRVNDAYADLLDACGADVYSIAMTDEEADKYHIVPKEFWMSELAKITEKLESHAPTNC